METICVWICCAFGVCVVAFMALAVFAAAFDQWLTISNVGLKVWRYYRNRLEFERWLADKEAKAASDEFGALLQTERVDQPGGPNPHHIERKCSCGSVLVSGRFCEKCWENE